MKINKLLLTALAGSLFFVSCNNDDDSNAPAGAYDNGVIVLNQGGFGVGNASVSFISNAMSLQNDIFATNNPGHILGDTGQDIGFNGDLAYVVLNASNKIEVVNRYSFLHVATIEGNLSNPRYIAFKNNKAYVTNWGDAGIPTDDYVAVIDLATNAVTSSIPVVEGPERILEHNGKLYVSHYGGYNTGESVTVIDIASGSKTSIATGDGPRSMVIENNVLYVLSEGLQTWGMGVDTPGKLQTVNLSNNMVTSTLNFSADAHPSNLVEEDGKLYYTIGSGIYAMNLNAASLPTSPIFSHTAQGVYGIYSFEVEDDQIFVGDAGDYSSNGKVFIYNPAGQKLEEFTVGVIPAGIYFND